MYADQPVWRCISQNKNSSGGYYVWEIVQFMGSLKDSKPSSWAIHQYVQLRDDTYVMANCHHFWDKKDADKFFLERGASWQDVTLIRHTFPIITTLATELDEEEPDDYMIGSNIIPIRKDL